MNPNKHTTKLFFTAGLAALTLIAVGCIEEKRTYKEVFKGDLRLADKSTVCDDTSEYFYVPSTVESSRTSAVARPHWMGDAKHVKKVCTQTSIDFVEVDVNNDFNDNPANLKPVLSIPADYVDYKCTENADGKCTQKEEENKDISWKNKKYIVLKPADIDVQEVNFFPEQLRSLFVPSCVTEVDKSLLRASFENDAINITIKKSFKTGVSCAGQLRDLSDLGFNVHYHYSLVKLESVADKNYKALEYPHNEEQAFGFFDTDSNKLEVDNNAMVSGEKTFVNRWSPHKVVKYHLNSSFLKPENQYLIAVTSEAVEKINKGLVSVGANMQIELVGPDKSGDLMTGDIRINSIVLEDSPLAMGVIGYGPSAANKRTGEILHGRTVMYLGSIRKYLHVVYNQFVDAKKLVEDSKLPLNSKSNLAKLEISPQLLQMGKMYKASKESIFGHLKEKNNLDLHDHNHSHGAHTDDINRLSVSDEQLKELATGVKANVYSRLEDINDPEKALNFLMDKNCYYTQDLIAPDSGLDEQINDLVNKFGLKSWDELSSDQRQEALTLLTPFMWTPVLVHELGHNLGLRHNFGGSEDKDNFYTKEELADMGISRDISYSSVMDYSYSTLNELPVLGKYDLAALRYGYAEEVAVTDTNFMGQSTIRYVSLKEFRDKNKNSDKKLELKPYKYCTDEHVALNPNCNRFDEGTTFLEIAQHHIKAHQKGYERHNLRNGKSNFSLYDDLSYLGRLDRSLGGLRLVFERYESITKLIGANHPAWTSNEYLKDLKAATLTGARYLTKVLLTPDLMCAVAERAKPTNIIGLISLAQLNSSNANCYSQETAESLNEKYIVVGHVGKLFQSKKSPSNKNPYIDQIDVRGIWLDKLLALEILTQRETGVYNFDKFQDNFLDIPEVASEIEATLKDITMNQVVDEITIETPAGQKLKLDYPVSLFDESENTNGHRVLDPLSSLVSKVLNLPKGNPTFQKVLIQTLKVNLNSDKQHDDSASMLNSIKAHQLDLGDSLTSDDFVTAKIGSRNYAAAKTSALAAQSIASHELAGILEKIGSELAQKVLQDISAGKSPAEDAPVEEQMAHALGAQILVAYLNGVIQPKSFYSELIKNMALELN